MATRKPTPSPRHRQPPDGSPFLAPGSINLNTVLQVVSVIAVLYTVIHNYDSLEASVNQKATELNAKIDQKSTEIQGKVDQKTTELGGQLQVQSTEIKAVNDKLASHDSQFKGIYDTVGKLRDSLMGGKR